MTTPRRSNADRAQVEKAALDKLADAVAERLGLQTQPLMKSGEVAAMLQIPRDTVYEYVRRNELPHMKVGRHLRFERVELARWIAAQRVRERE